MLDELAQLEDRRIKLHVYMQGERFHVECAEDERILMIEQANAMDAYSKYLHLRIMRFGVVL